MQIHSKKRNRLAQQRLNDLVFVKYNRTLKRRYDARDRLDPICLGDIDDSNEWLMGPMDGGSENEDELVFDDDNLTWDVVARASGVEEEAYHTRATKGRNVGSTSTLCVRSKQVEKAKRSSQKRINTPPILRNEESDFEEDDGEEVESDHEEIEEFNEDEDEDDYVELDDDE